MNGQERIPLPSHYVSVLAELHNEHQFQARGVLRAAAAELKLGPEWTLDPNTNEFVRNQ